MLFDKFISPVNNVIEVASRFSGVIEHQMATIGRILSSETKEENP